jgi:AraC-like DNA-binding protein
LAIDLRPTHALKISYAVTPRSQNCTKHPINIAQLTSRGGASLKTEENMAERVKRVIELMQGDPSRSFTLGKMAESVNLSPPYFCYLFKTITGVPPAKYLKSLRMQQAATLLTTTFLSIKEIVRRVGLTDESHFVRDFKRLYAMTPSEYRNSALLSTDHANIERAAKDQSQDGKRSTEGIL